MTLLESHYIQCPYCWEQVELSIENAIEEQQYIEDCQVCCNPIDIIVKIAPDGSAQVEAKQEND